MKDEYSFSKGERGKFYHSTAKFQLPVYLDDDVMDYLRRRASAEGREISELVNMLVKQDMAQVGS